METAPPTLRLRNLVQENLHGRLGGGIYTLTGMEGAVTHPLGSLFLPPPSTHPHF